MTEQESVQAQLAQIAALRTPVTNVYRRLIPAAVAGVAGETVIDTMGHYFYVKESDKTCLYQMDDGREQPFDVGTGPNTRGLGMFKKITIKNIFSTPVTVEIVAGLGEFIDNRFTLVPSRDFALPVYEANTVITGLGDVANFVGGNIAPNSFVPLSGICALPLRKRKCVVVSNMDAANSVYLCDSAHVKCAAVEFGTTHSHDISGYVEIFNGTAGAIPLCISEIWISQ